MVTIGSIGFLFIFGAYFAWREYHRPIYPTWLAVFFGTGATLSGITAILLDTFDRNTALTAAAIAWGGFVITGGMMIVAQARKESTFADEAQRREYNTGKLGNDETQKDTIPPRMGD